MALEKGTKIKVVRAFFLENKSKKVADLKKAGTILEIGKDITVHDANMVYFAQKATTDLSVEAAPEVKAAKPAPVK